ncbi:MAG: hypothetical protein ACTSQE_12350 [Candidatus Heimdallarchaeaceae archaeon]
MNNKYIKKLRLAIYSLSFMICLLSTACSEFDLSGAWSSHQEEDHFKTTSDNNKAEAQKAIKKW